MIESTIISFEEYIGKENTLLTCVSYEDRPILYLEKILMRNNIKKCILIKLTDLLSDNQKWNSLNISESEEEDMKVKKEWKKNYEKFIKILNKWDIDIIEVSGSYFRPYDVSKKINDILTSKEDVLFDISALPKHILLSILRWCENKDFTFLYARPEVEKSAEVEFSVGMERVGILRGYEGEIRFDRMNVLVLVLGFEGARALSIFRHFEPYRTLALLGNPQPLYDDDLCNFYLDNAYKNNSQLLSNQRVINRKISSLIPNIFKNELNKEIFEYIEESDSNISISCLGTKPQTLGLYLYWLEHKNIQIIYTIPSKRRIPSKGIKEILIYKINL